MKFAASLAALVGVASATILDRELAERDSSLCSYGTTGLQAQMAYVYPLFQACQTSLNGNYANPWANAVCVAAAVSGSPGLVRDALSCSSSSVPALTALPYLDYTVYAGIVGSCAYASKACSITQQNLIDLIYREIGTESSATWPTSASAVVSNYITPLMDWTATGSSIPYTNFNDWLHYAPDDTVEDC